MNRITFGTADRFRAAISAGRFQDADHLLAAMRTEVEAVWNAASREERQRIAGETSRLLAWARATILASRAHTQSKLAALSHECAYISSRSAHPVRLNLEG